MRTHVTRSEHPTRVKRHDDDDDDGNRIGFPPGYQDDHYCDCPGGTLLPSITAAVEAAPIELGPREVAAAAAAALREVAASNVRIPNRLRGDWLRSKQGQHVLKQGDIVWKVHTDEPNTDACSMLLVAQKVFHCGTGNYDTDYIFSSRVHDGVCDCCDGSDEQGTPWPDVACSNTCNAIQAVYVERKANVAQEAAAVAHRARAAALLAGQSQGHGQGQQYRGRLGGAGAGVGRTHGQIGRGLKEQGARG